MAHSHVTPEKVKHSDEFLKRVDNIPNMLDAALNETLDDEDKYKISMQLSSIVNLLSANTFTIDLKCRNGVLNSRKNRGITTYDIGIKSAAKSDHADLYIMLGRMPRSTPSGGRYGVFKLNDVVDGMAETAPTPISTFYNLVNNYVSYGEFILKPAKP